MEGDEPNGIVFINKGKVKTFKTNEDGKEFITSIQNEGDFIGYIDLIENSEYRESAEALEEAEICIIPKQDFSLSSIPTVMSPLSLSSCSVTTSRKWKKN